MSRNLWRDYYLSIDSGEPLDLPGCVADGHDWPDAPLPYRSGETTRTEGVLSLVCAIGGVTFFGLIAYAASWAVQ